MSYTQFVGTATLSVFDGFNLNSYLDSIAERCVREQNFIYEEYGEENGKVDINFNNYVREVGDKILIECDTEETNGNSEVYDWLIEQFIPIMNSRFIEIKSAVIDSRTGVDVDIFYINKLGETIGTQDLIEKYIQSLPA